MPIQFEIPSSVRYSCTMCGDCCRSFNVLLGPGEVKPLEDLDWAGRVDRLVSVPKSQPSADPRLKGRRQIARRSDGRCVFLDDDNLCLIHKQFGEDAKPLVCRLYPFGFYPMGDRLGVEVNFSCNAVSRGHGDDVKTRVPEWQKLLLESPLKPDASRHRLDAARPISAVLMWELEFYLTGFLKNSAMPFHDRVRACLQFLKLALTGDPTKPTAGVLREAIARGMPSQLAKLPAPDPPDRTQRVFFYQLLYVSINPTPPGYWEMGRIERELEKEARLRAGEQFRDRAGNARAGNVPLDVDFAAIDAVAPGAFASPVQPFLESYFCAKITGQRFLLDTGGELPFIEAAHRLFLLYPMILWTAKAQAAQDGRNVVEEMDLRRAVRLLEGSFGTVTLSDFPQKQRDAGRFLLLETDLVMSMTMELLAGSPPPEDPAP